MGYKYSVYFEGTLEVYSEEPLTEEEVFDEAHDIINSDGRTWLDSSCAIENFEITDTEEEE